jgi:hypothetical protein
MSSCAFGDCGRPACPVCAPARVLSEGSGLKPHSLLPAETSAVLVEAVRADAPAVPKADRVRPTWLPKKRHRVGPHR